MSIGKNVSRRDFIKLTTGAIAAAGVMKIQPAFGQSNIPIAVQLYCVRKEAAQDLPGALSRLSRMGYQGVEFADYFDRSAKELRQLLDDNGLKAAGTHIYLEDMLGDALPATIEFNQTTGNRNLIVRSLKKSQYENKDAILKLADTMNGVAEKLQPHGMRIGYHNHSEIFNRYDGEMAWNILADNTRKDVILQLDTGNAMEASGVEIVDLVRRNPGRTVTTHIKPYSKSNPNAFLGDDELPWKTIINLMETTAGTEWFIIEYEREGTPPFEALDANLKRFKQLLGRA
ncbi:MAG TPA: TIM barrel protein [Rhodothermales bacterium]|nr:TIM barrel protein [Rhodothermales bacterium]